MKQAAKKKKENGYFLLDAVVTIFISMFVLGVILGGISHASKTVASAKDRIIVAIEERNEFEKEPRIAPRQ